MDLFLRLTSKTSTPLFLWSILSLLCFWLLIGWLRILPSFYWLDCENSHWRVIAVHQLISYFCSFHQVSPSAAEDAKTPIRRRPESSSSKAAVEDNSEESKPTVVQVPEMDDVAEFFTPQSTQDNIEVTSDDFDHLFVYSAQM